MLDLPYPHNPALPGERRRLAAEVLRAGTALALDVPRAVAVQAERDARSLCALHGTANEALRRLGQQAGAAAGEARQAIGAEAAGCPVPVGG